MFHGQDGSSLSSEHMKTQTVADTLSFTIIHLFKVCVVFHNCIHCFSVNQQGQVIIFLLMYHVVQTVMNSQITICTPVSKMNANPLLSTDLIGAGLLEYLDDRSCLRHGKLSDQAWELSGSTMRFLSVSTTCKEKRVRWEMLYNPAFREQH